MQKTWFVILAVIGLAGTYHVAVSAAPPDVREVPLRLSGCVIAGEAKDSYLLTNVVVDSSTMTPPNAFYRFDTTKGLKNYVGRRVEVKGKADLADVDEGTVKLRTDAGKVSTSVTSERRTVTANDAWFGSAGAMKLDVAVATYKFEVDSVTPLQGNCANAATAR